MYPVDLYINVAENAARVRDKERAGDNIDWKIRHSYMFSDRTTLCIFYGWEPEELKRVIYGTFIKEKSH